MECIFCKIASGDLKVQIVYRDEYVMAFKDLKPQAPVHLVLIPIKHIATAQEVDDSRLKDVARLFAAVPEIARRNDLAERGYRLVVNCNRDAGQEVFHLHMHLLGGRKFSWPPG